ncbi:hypothetical protein BH23BAC4_BH23BAC4_14780 [soil metagenome]
MVVPSAGVSLLDVTRVAPCVDDSSPVFFHGNVRSRQLGVRFGLPLELKVRPPGGRRVNIGVTGFMNVNPHATYGGFGALVGIGHLR